MPVNSFDNYPMSWTPDREKLTYPIYYCLADMMEQEDVYKRQQFFGFRHAMWML